MSDSTAAPADPELVVDEPAPAAPAPRQPQVVISQHAVMLGTAAAVSAHDEKSGQHVIAAFVARHLHHGVHHAHPHYPPRMDDVLEHAAMEREMHRL